MKILDTLNEITFPGAEVMLKVAAPVYKRGFGLRVLITVEETGGRPLKPPVTSIPHSI